MGNEGRKWYCAWFAGTHAAGFTVPPPDSRSATDGSSYDDFDFPAEPTEDRDICPAIRKEEAREGRREVS